MPRPFVAGTVKPGEMVHLGQIFSVDEVKRLGTHNILQGATLGPAGVIVAPMGGPTTQVPPGPRVIVPLKGVVVDRPTVGMEEVGMTTRNGGFGEIAKRVLTTAGEIANAVQGNQGGVSLGAVVGQVLGAVATTRRGRRGGKGRVTFKSVGQRGKVGLADASGNVFRVIRVGTTAHIGKNLPSHKQITRLRRNLHRHVADAKTILRLASPGSLKGARRGGGRRGHRPRGRR